MNEQFDIPASWEVVTLEAVAEGKNAIVDGPFGSNLKTSDYIDDNINGVPVLTTKNLEGDYSDKKVRFISKEKFEELKRSQVNPGDILVAKIGSIGKTGIYPKNARVAIIPANLLKFTVSRNVVFNYVFYYINSRGFQNRIKKISTATAQPAFNVTKFRKLLIPLPPKPTQEAIVSKIEELFSELDKGIENLRSAQQQLKTYRQSVLKWAFEGKQQTTVGDLFDFVGGGTPSKKEGNYWIGNIPWASVKDIKGDFLNDTEDRISEEGLNNSTSNIAHPNEVILITRISPGKTIITNIKTAVNQDLKIVKPKFKTTSKFIYYVFKSIERECVKRSSGTTVLGINLINLKEIEVPKLEFEDQNAIVQEIESRLSVADKIEESITQSLQKSEALRQSILKKAFEGKLIN